MVSLLAASALVFQSPRVLTEQITLASMFKNGYAVVIREMPIAGSGDYLLEKIPTASLGTLWFTTTENTQLTSVINTEIPRSTDVKVQSIAELLLINVGKRVTLHFAGNQTPITGTLVNASGNLIQVKSGEETHSVERGSIIRVVSPDTMSDSQKVNSTIRGLRFQVESKGAGKIIMVSLERGMTWAPGYAVTLKPGKKLQVVGKSTVINDLQDLNGIEVRFITGWPNIPYAGIPDPLSDASAFQAAIGGPGGLPAGGGFGGGRAGEMFRNQAPAARDFGESMPQADLGGIQAEDLFFYRQPNVKLKKGERGYFIVLVMESPYEDLYTWDIDDFVQDATYRPMPPTPVDEEVWHTIRFTNTTKQPFSTGAATIFKDEQIIGQDMMRYASPNGKAELKITKAMDIGAEQLEEETARERGALKNTYGNITHDLVSLKGTLTMVNRKSEAVTVRIRKQLTGEVVSTDPEAKVTKTARGLRDVNSRANLEWTQKIESGKTVTITYNYRVYIRV